MQTFSDISEFDFFKIKLSDIVLILSSCTFCTLELFCRQYDYSIEVVTDEEEK